MRAIEFSRSARRDIAVLSRESEALFGAAQRDNYLREMERRIALLREHPEIGPPYGARRPGLRRLQVGSHIAFYRFDAVQIHITRILHQRMDVERRLGRADR